MITVNKSQFFYMEINMKTKLWIERLWSVMGGLVFSILPSIRTGEGYRFFGNERWLDIDKWDDFGRSYYLDEFIVGFIFTYIFVKSLRKYNETNETKQVTN